MLGLNIYYNLNMKHILIFGFLCFSTLAHKTIEDEASPESLG